MVKQGKTEDTPALLDLWRPPTGAGDPVGCLASTYTFHPGLFDEQCLGRFLEIESEPNREDLAFLLERETRLGPVYAGVLVDHTQAGVEHSLRWDVLPVRLPHGKQHAKLSLLVWQRHLRLIVASANLTEQGYRLNQEVCVALDSSPDGAERSAVEDACTFFRQLLTFVPGAEPEAPAVWRALRFLEQTEELIGTWQRSKQRKGQRQHLVFSLPSKNRTPITGGNSFKRQSTLDTTLDRCSRRGGAPEEVWIASPFYDEDHSLDAATQSLCKSMARGSERKVCFTVPCKGEDDENRMLFAAPESLFRTARHYNTAPTVATLPEIDEDENVRPWHAKMLRLLRRGKNGYTALLVGSSNFTFAGMGLGGACNAEANLLTVADHLPHARLPGQLTAVWPETEKLESETSIKWEGPELDLEDQPPARVLPAGFLSATYRAGDDRSLLLRLDPEQLPDDWSMVAAGQSASELLCAQAWRDQSKPTRPELAWHPLQPPEKLLVRWASDGMPAQEAFLPLNVEDSRQLPPPLDLKEMTADDMLRILAASDPGAAIRKWTNGQRKKTDRVFDDELDAAAPPDLDPLSRHTLSTTFLRRIRGRARILAQLRANLQRPVWSQRALQWRLEGFIGIRPLADRLLEEVWTADGPADEALLTLADLVIVLHEVRYEPCDGALCRDDFESVYTRFLGETVDELDRQLSDRRGQVSKEIYEFWSRMVQRCRS